MKVDDYMVVEDTDLSDFEKRIDNLICDGWVPKGGIMVDHAIYYQAMIKYEPTKNVTYVRECA